MRIKEISVLLLNGKKIEIIHEGLKPLTGNSWLVLIEGITQDFELGKGFYPYANFEASVEWKFID